MKKCLIVILAVLCFVSGIFVSRLTGIDDLILTSTETSTKVESKNTSPTILYPKEKYEWEKPVFISLSDDKFYHQNGPCQFGKEYVNGDNYLFVSKYEAVYRGYLPCPNCVFEKVDIRK